MKKRIEQITPRLLTVGIILEVIVLVAAWLESGGATAPFFQACARLSGRVSVLFFSVLMIYATLSPGFERGSNEYRIKYILFRDFAVIHIIHWFLLAASVSLTQFEILPIRLAGGVVAYVLVGVMPWLMTQASTSFAILTAVQASYMFWVWLVFTMTYTARLSGSTPVHTGSPASWWPFFVWLIGLVFWRSYVLLRQNWVTKK